MYVISTVKVYRSGQSYGTSTLTAANGIALICAANAVGGNTTGNFANRYTNYASVEAEEFKNYASILGDAFTTDVNNINNGYPILKWQLEN